MGQDKRLSPAQTDSPSIILAHIYFYYQGRFFFSHYYSADNPFNEYSDSPGCVVVLLAAAHHINIILVAVMPSITRRWQQFIIFIIILPKIRRFFFSL
ncbi:hypothetical protein GDO81_021500 [Engystomops pustulosus]|uniref:Uncharacterized protein n=1 Tax=Engystomops pustulosus TaxID=76066 RepID=A0AAV6Z785_ENGPU|nr:hypothetical protein GDO81_021500 [Engystomops pustulosus]